MPVKYKELVSLFSWIPLSTFMSALSFAGVTFFQYSLLILLACSGGLPLSAGGSFYLHFHVCGLALNPPCPDWASLSDCRLLFCWFLARFLITRFLDWAASFIPCLTAAWPLWFMLSLLFFARLLMNVAGLELSFFHCLLFYLYFLSGYCICIGDLVCGVWALICPIVGSSYSTPTTTAYVNCAVGSQRRSLLGFGCPRVSIVIYRSYFICFKSGFYTI